MTIHSDAQLLQAGYVALDYPAQLEMPGFGTMRRLCAEQDVRWGGLRSFRTAEGWKFYRAPDAVLGFVDEPVMPRRA